MLGKSWNSTVCTKTTHFIFLKFFVVIIVVNIYIYIYCVNLCFFFIIFFLWVGLSAIVGWATSPHGLEAHTYLGWASSPHGLEAHTSLGWASSPHGLEAYPLMCLGWVQKPDPSSSATGPDIWAGLFTCSHAVNGAVNGGNEEDHEQWVFFECYDRSTC